MHRIGDIRKDQQQWTYRLQRNTQSYLLNRTPIPLYSTLTHVTGNTLSLRSLMDIFKKKKKNTTTVPHHNHEFVKEESCILSCTGRNRLYDTSAGEVTMPSIFRPPKRTKQSDPNVNPSPPPIPTPREKKNKMDSRFIKRGISRSFPPIQRRFFHTRLFQIRNKSNT